MKLREWRQTKRDKAIIIELEMSWYELSSLISNLHKGNAKQLELAELLEPIREESDEPS